jgi:hypothetical protein
MALPELMNGVQVSYGLTNSGVTVEVVTNKDGWTAGEVEEIHDFFKTLLETKYSGTSSGSSATNFVGTDVPV